MKKIPAVRLVNPLVLLEIPNPRLSAAIAFLSFPAGIQACACAPAILATRKLIIPSAKPAAIHTPAQGSNTPGQLSVTMPGVIAINLRLALSLSLSFSFSHLDEQTGLETVSVQAEEAGFMGSHYDVDVSPRALSRTVLIKRATRAPKPRSRRCVGVVRSYTRRRNISTGRAVWSFGATEYREV